MIVYPTHTCFDDALDMLCEAIKANPGSAHSDELKLVHGICVAPDGKKYSHAWVESDRRIAWFAGVVDGKKTQLAAPIEEYYIEINVVETTKYTPRQAWEENYRHANYGPWLEKYKRLCNESL